jgi:hypothetical protein
MKHVAETFLSRHWPIRIQAAILAILRSAVVVDLSLFGSIDCAVAVNLDRTHYEEESVLLS